MFENIIGHAEIISALSHELRSRQLPASLLFYGPRNGAKLTVALELARVLTCPHDGEWSCSCTACDQHRTLNHANTVMTGNRNFTNEIAASADVLVRTRKAGSQYLFVRAVRKLLRRFDPVLWEGNEPKFKNAMSSAEKIEDQLEQLMPERVLPEPDSLAKITDRIVAECEKIGEGTSVSSVSVAQVRRIGSWVYTSTNEPAKVVILDGAEDLSESARNALLKTLEEPPENVYFILISERRSAIIPTIVSRLRPYRFNERPADEVREVLRRIFAEDSGEYASIDEYFMAWSFPDLLRNEARKFWEALTSGSVFREDPTLLADLEKAISTKKAFRPFLYELTRILHENIRANQDPVELSIAERWTSLMHEALNSAERYNQSPSLLFESMYYQMRAVG